MSPYPNLPHISSLLDAGTKDQADCEIPKDREMLLDVPVAFWCLILHPFPLPG